MGTTPTTTNSAKLMTPLERHEVEQREVRQLEAMRDAGNRPRHAAPGWQEEDHDWFARRGVGRDY